ncbi:hypothetical protein A0J61_04188 [Choanephora cucurbitarum]|uniref:SWIM-type domain-containing protein n=1 Tax=Choanephora cucurbitarum TaxID=101091 RepID=A0A1C7NFL6_9FUNG|nr:hypothetical protein A0J61_04188 [Choanephora cucurbitarum]
MHKEPSTSFVEEAIFSLQHNEPSVVLEMLKSEGVNYTTKEDLESLKQLGGSSLDMTLLIIHLQRLQYNVRFTTNGKDCITSVFFISDRAIQELRRFPESIVVNTTYRTDRQIYDFVNFVIAGTVCCRPRSDPLATISVAGAWMEKDTRSNYKWALSQMRELVWPDQLSPKPYELPSVFITEDSATLKGALSDIFPGSAQLICYAQLERKLKQRFLKELELTDESRDKYEEKHRSLISDIARNCTTKEEHEKAKKAYIDFLNTDGLLTNKKVLSFTVVVFLLQKEEQWGSYYANAHPHMNERTTNRAKNIYALMKQKIGSSEGKIGPFADHIDHWYKEKIDECDSQMEKETFTSPVCVVTSSVSGILRPLITKATLFALIEIAKELIEGLNEKEEGRLSDTCSCFIKIWRLPCRHKLLKCIENENTLIIGDIHPRWRTETSYERDDRLSKDSLNRKLVEVPGDHQDTVNDTNCHLDEISIRDKTHQENQDSTSSGIPNEELNENSKKRQSESEEASNRSKKTRANDTEVTINEDARDESVVDGSDIDPIRCEQKGKLLPNICKYLVLTSASDYEHEIVCID